MLFNFLFYSFICIVFLILYNKQEDADARAGMFLFTILTVIWLWIVLAFREPTGDPLRYMRGFNYIAQMSISELLSYNQVPLGFSFLNWLTATISLESEVFFSVIYASCLIPLYLAFRERVSRVDASLLLMLYLLYPFYLTYVGSGFKQGIGFGFMLWGLNCIIDRGDPKWAKGVLLLFTSTVFHTSFWLVNIALAGWYVLFRKLHIRWSLCIIAICVVLAASGLNDYLVTAVIPQNILERLGFSSYFDDEFLLGDEYLSRNYQAGFRLDFAIFTLAPIFLIIYYLSRDQYCKGLDLIKIYSILASFYFLMTFIPYSDRIASFSWFLAPFMIFTILNQPHLSKLKNQFVFAVITSYPFVMLWYSKRFFQ